MHKNDLQAQDDVGEQHRLTSFPLPAPLFLLERLHIFPAVAFSISFCGKGQITFWLGWTMFFRAACGFSAHSRYQKMVWEVG